jgi:hypothetical protein
MKRTYRKILLKAVLNFLFSTAIAKHRFASNLLLEEEELILDPLIHALR